MTLPNPPRRPGSSSDLKPVLDEQPERGVVHHSGVDGVPQRAPARTTLTDLPRARLPEAKATLTGAPPPPPPRLPLDLSPTVKAPPLPFRKTMRVGSPAGLLAAARRSEPPAASDPPPTSARVPGDEKRASASLPPPSMSPEAATVDALRRRAEAAEARRDELERRERVRSEAQSPAGWPPRVERSQSPVPSSERESKPPSRGDWAKLRFKVATAIVAALVLVIGALAYWGVAAINAKAEAIKAAQEAKKDADSREEQWRSWASVVIWIEDCRDGRDVRSGEMLLPDLNKQGSARKLEPWQNPCSPKLPPPP